MTSTLLSSATTAASDPASHPAADVVGPAPVDRWDEPAGVAARGTLVVLTGRGESAAAYGRFGRRISADAYRVRVVEVDLDDLASARDRVAAMLTDDALPAPRVLVGTDTGATYAALLAHEVSPDAVVLAGLVVPGTRSARTSEQDADAELETRSACPAHRRVLTEDAAFSWGALHRELPAAWSGARLAASGLPTLVLHGSDDDLTSVDDALAVFRRAPTTHTHVVQGGRHDVLNDVTHRSVAATIVLFLERLKLGADLPVIVRAESPH